MVCGEEALCHRRAKGPAGAERNQENLPQREKNLHWCREKWKRLCHKQAKLTAGQSRRKGLCPGRPKVLPGQREEKEIG